MELQKLKSLIENAWEDLKLLDYKEYHKTIETIQVPTSLIISISTKSTDKKTSLNNVLREYKLSV